jgi:hypothetical protein
LRGSEGGRKPGVSSILVVFMSDDLGQPRLGKHGGPRTKGQRSAETMPTGVRRDYILARLERDGRHDLAGAIREGRVSAYSIAVELGWTKRAEPIGRSVNAAKRRQHQLRMLPGLPGAANNLNYGALMELWLGPPHDGSYFGSREELEQAWEQNRDLVMRLWGSHGRRLMAWWEFDAGDLKHPGYDRERSTLWRAGVLTAEEKAELEREWRREFEQAQAPDFTVNDGSGEVLTGIRARRAHYAWADVPDELVERWTAERRRRWRQPPPSEGVAATKSLS